MCKRVACQDQPKRKHDHLYWWSLPYYTVIKSILRIAKSKLTCRRPTLPMTKNVLAHIFIYTIHVCRSHSAFISKTDPYIFHYLRSNRLVSIVSRAVREEVVYDHSDDRKQEHNQAPDDLFYNRAVGLDNLNCCANELVSSCPEAGRWTYSMQWCQELEQSIRQFRRRYQLAMRLIAWWWVLLQQGGKTRVGEER